MEYLFYSVIVVCFTIIVAMLIDFYRISLHIKQENSGSRDIRKFEDLTVKLNQIENKTNIASEDAIKQVKDLEDVKKRVDVLTLKAGFKL